jgi:hypothetical protein
MKREKAVVEEGCLGLPSKRLNWLFIIVPIKGKYIPSPPESFNE